MTDKGKHISGIRKCPKLKAMAVNRKWCEEERGINTCPWPMVSANVVYLDSTWTPHLIDENEQERLISIQWSEIGVIITSTLRSWNNYPRDAQLINRNNGCIWNRKDWPKRTPDIMVETLKILNDARNISYATISQEYKFKFERSRPCYSIQVLKKRPRRWGANVICLANLARHVIVWDLIRLGVTCQQGNGSTSLGSTALSAPRKWHSYDLELGQRSRLVRAKALLPKWSGATSYIKGWVNCDLELTIRKYNRKHHQSIHCQKPDGRYHRCDCSPQEETAEHAIK